MSKKLLIGLTAAAFIFSVAIIGSNAIAKDTGAADMVLKTEEGKKPATFPHKKHQDAYPCATCHHKSDDAGKQIPCGDEDKIEKCATCHNSTKMTPESKLDSYKNAAHAMCKECHKKEAKGPTKCDGCHPKE